MTDLFAISLTSDEGDFVYLTDSGVVTPDPGYDPYSKPQPLGNGGTRGAGWPIATWTWTALRSEDFEFLRTYCADLYADDIWIKTPDHNGDWVTARTKMFWPRGVKWDGDVIQGFTVTFMVKSSTPIV